MFSQKQRLNSCLVSQIIKTGKKVFNRNFKIFFIKDKNFKVSLVISKKILKRRVDRNCEKRRIIHLIKKIYKNNLPQLNIVIFIQKNTQKLSLLELEKEIKNIFNKIN